MPIQTQCCGLLIVCIIIYLTYREHNLMLPSRRLYLGLLFATLTCIGLDILSVIGIVVPFPTFWRNFVCKIYLSSLALVCYLGLLYANEELHYFIAKKEHPGRRAALLLPGIAGTVLPLFFPIQVYYDGRALYSYGPACICTYTFCFIFILTTLWLCIFRMKHVNRHRRRVIAIWQLIYIVSAVIQCLYPEQLIVGFATSIGMFLLFSQLENPSEDIDRQTGCYNLELLKKFLVDRYKNRRSFAAAAIVLEPREGRWNELERRSAVAQAAECLHPIRKAAVFHIVSNEFIVIFSDADALQKNINPMRDRLREQFQDKGDRRDGHISIRYYLIPDSNEASSVEELVDCHSYYLEHFQDSEINRIDADAFARERAYRAVKESLRKALQEDRIEVFYQPIYDIDNQDFHTAEALARLRQEDGTLMPPGEFIPVAEDSGLIRSLGLRVLEKVCAFISQGSAMELGLRCIHVNLSAVQLDDPELPDQISGILRRFRIHPGQISFEITESAKIGRKKTAYDTLDRLSKLGMPLSLDDFGTGRSNLDYFIDLPVSVVKFDKTFTQSYFSNDKTRYVMQSVIHMIRNMGLSIVIEGIETKDEFELIRRLSINYIQGYYFSKPLPENEFLLFLDAAGNEKRGQDKKEDGKRSGHSSTVRVETFPLSGSPQERVSMNLADRKVTFK